MTQQTIRLGGKRYVIIEANELADLRSRAAAVDRPLASGDQGKLFPAVQTARDSIAREIVAGRRQADWSQAELARRAKVRVETLNKIERSKATARPKTIERIAKALKSAGVAV